MESKENNYASRKVIKIPVGNIELEANLKVPDNPRAIIIFSHGSGSSRLSPRNQFIAQYLNEDNFASLLFDLLTKEEAEIDKQNNEYRNNIQLLSERLLKVTDWIMNHIITRNLQVGYFGSGTGAAASIIAAVKKQKYIYAIVSRGGRIDLAENYFSELSSPILFITGGNDLPTIESNRQVLSRIHGERKLEIIPGAGHLFEEKGMLLEVARQTLKWFEKYL